MKKSILVVLAVAALCGNVAFANSPSQDKPVSKTVTTVKTTPTKATAKTAGKKSKTVHKKHVTNS